MECFACTVSRWSQILRGACLATQPSPDVPFLVIRGTTNVAVVVTIDQSEAKSKKLNSPGELVIIVMVYQLTTMARMSDWFMPCAKHLKDLLYAERPSTRTLRKVLAATMLVCTLPLGSIWKRILENCKSSSIDCNRQQPRS
jgi:hypothetical protein